MRGAGQRPEYGQPPSPSRRRNRSPLAPSSRPGQPDGPAPTPAGPARGKPAAADFRSWDPDTSTPLLAVSEIPGLEWKPKGPHRQAVRAPRQMHGQRGEEIADSAPAA